MDEREQRRLERERRRQAGGTSRSSRSAAHRRRRLVAAAVVVAAIAVPILAVTALGGGGGGGGTAAPTTRPAETTPKKKRGTQKRKVRLPTAAEQKRAVDRLVRLGLPIFCTPLRDKYVALTFDDGPSELTPKFHALLKRFGVRSTFFIVGANMSSDALARFARGDLALGGVANHTWAHDNLAELSSAEVRANLVRTNQAITKATGATVTLFRPPFGARNETVLARAKELGMATVLWNVDSSDWNQGITWQQIGRNVLRGLRGGSIILMHDSYVRHETLKALELMILPELKKRGLVAVTVPELLALNPPSVEQVRADAARGGCSLQFG